MAIQSIEQQAWFFWAPETRLCPQIPRAALRQRYFHIDIVELHVWPRTAYRLAGLRLPPRIGPGGSYRRRYGRFGKLITRHCDRTATAAAGGRLVSRGDYRLRNALTLQLGQHPFGPHQNRQKRSR